jgi:CRISPR-associated exonuclease Cas4
MGPGVGDPVALEPILISALGHWVFCDRRSALQYVEGVWAENFYTVSGSLAHRAVDEGQPRWAEGKLHERAVHLWSERLGLTGLADTIIWEGASPVPMEHKPKAKRRHLSARVQLAAQALCLEEMFSCQLERGYLYDQSSRQRVPVLIDESLRALVKRTAEEMRGALAASRVPAARLDARCKGCSLHEFCLPEITTPQERRLKIMRARILNPEVE